MCFLPLLVFISNFPIWFFSFFFFFFIFYQQKRKTEMGERRMIDGRFLENGP